MDRRQVIVYWLPVILYASLIFYLSSLPKPTRMPTGEVLYISEPESQFLHVLEYFILAFLLFRALKNTVSIPLSKLALLAVVIAVIYGVSDEIHQSFVPNRSCSPIDLFLDGVGSLIASLLLYHFSLRIPRYRVDPSKDRG